MDLAYRTHSAAKYAKIFLHEKYSRKILTTKSKEDLGYTETEKWYARHLQACQPSSNKHTTIHGLEKARKGEAGTVFDWLVEILFEHGPSGAEPEAGVILRLE